ncbi:MAG: PKD domain-containing protein [Crocinitomicaceae bacterium]
MKNLFLLTFTMMFTSIGMSQYTLNIADYGMDATNPFDPSPNWTITTSNLNTAPITGGAMEGSLYVQVDNISLPYSLDAVLELPDMGNYSGVKFTVEFSTYTTGSGSGSLNVGDVITLYTSNDGTSWTPVGSWTDSDGGSFDQSITFINTGDTYVKIELNGEYDGSDNFMLNNFKVDVNPNPLPTADFTTFPTTVSNGSLIDFTNTSTTTGTVTYNWTFTGADVTTSSDPNPTGITYSTAGTYTVELTVTDDGGTDTETKVDYITVIDGPIVNFSASSTSLLEGESVNFTDLSSYGTGVSWSWTFTGADTPTSTDQNPTGITYSTTGTYTVELTVTDDLGSDTETKVDYIYIGSVGVDENISDFNIYAQGNFLMLKVNGNHQYNITVYNLSGKKMFTDESVGNQQYDLNLPSGLYLVHINDGKTDFQKKVFIR